jgi:hypothetical protein
MAVPLVSPMTATRPGTPLGEKDTFADVASRGTNVWLWTVPANVADPETDDEPPPQHSAAAAAPTIAIRMLSPDCDYPTEDHARKWTYSAMAS